MIYLFCTLFVGVCISSLASINVLQDQSDAATTADFVGLSLSQTLNLIRVVISLSIFIVIVLVAANSRAKSVWYLLTGALLFLLLTVVLPSTASLFKAYTRIIEDSPAQCSRLLDIISYESLRSYGCEQKYIFKSNSTTHCGGSDFSKCFESIENISTTALAISKSFITTVWETSLYPHASSRPRLAGLQAKCCGTVTNIQARPILNLIGLVLAFILLAFILACFAFKASNYNLLATSLQPAARSCYMTLFMTVFTASIITAIIIANQPNKPRRDSIVVGGTHVQRSSPVHSYHEFNKCTTFQYFNDETLVDVEYKPLVLKNLSIASANSTFCGTAACQSPNLLVVLQTVRSETDACPLNFYFDYDQGHRDDVHVISSTVVKQFASTSVCEDAVTHQKRCVACRNFLGVAGEPKAVINFIYERVKACNRAGLFFVVQPYQVNRNLFNQVAVVTQKEVIQMKKSLQHSRHDRTTPPPSRVTASLNNIQLTVSVRDIVSSMVVPSATVILYESYEQEITCEASATAKRIEKKQYTNSKGVVLFDFLYSTSLPSSTRYTVEVHSSSHAVNCRTFTLNENRRRLDVALSPPLKEHQIRFLLEWGAESDLKATRDLDLYLSANSEEAADKWLCYASYFSQSCAGAIHHGDSHGDLSTEGITINDLAKVKYLVFFKLPVIAATNGEQGQIDNAVIIKLRPLVKVFTFGQLKPIQATLFDPSIAKGITAGFENNYRFANLAWCINGINSEIVKSAKGYSYPVSWLTAEPKQAGEYDLPLASSTCA